MDAKTEALLPCAFCGGKGHVETTGSRPPMRAVVCEECGAKGQLSVVVNNAVEAWNTRALSSPEGKADAILAREMVATFQRWIDERDGDNALAGISAEAMALIRPRLENLISPEVKAEPVACFACEDSPKHPNNPCAVCHAYAPPRADQEDEIKRLREALTPSAETKAALIGEFYEEVEITNPNYDEDDEDSEEILRIRVPIQWTTVKEIMRAIAALATKRSDADG